MNQRRLPAINCRPAKVGFVSGISPSNFGLDSGQAIIKGIQRHLFSIATFQLGAPVVVVFLRLSALSWV